MPGIGELIDGAMQQAPQPGRQAGGAFMGWQPMALKKVLSEAGRLQ